MKKILIQYSNLKQEANGKLLMMQVGVFLCMYGEDAELASKVCSLKLAKISSLNGDIFKCGFPVEAQSKFQEKLELAGIPVAIAVEDSTSIDPILGLRRREIIECDEVHKSKNDSSLCDCKLCQQLRKINPAYLTPIEALNVLSKLKQLVEVSVHG